VPSVVGMNGMMVGGASVDLRTLLQCLQARGYDARIVDDPEPQRERDKQWEREWERERREREERASQASQDRERAANADYQRKLMEYQQLITVKLRLDQQKEMLDKEADSSSFRQAITEHNKQVAEYQLRVTAYSQRVIEDERVRKWREQ
jgi:hypothetical protein